MSKTLFSLAALLLGVNAFAAVTVGTPITTMDDANVRVTSFMYPDAGRSRVAEICGIVTGVATPALVKVEIDPMTNHPGEYYLSAGKNGRFCGSVVTYSGRAVVTLDR